MAAQTPAEPPTGIRTGGEASSPANAQRPSAFGRWVRLVLPAVAILFVADRVWTERQARADLDDLRIDLEATFEGSTFETYVDTLPVAPDDSSMLTTLTSFDGATPDAIEWFPGEHRLLARYNVDTDGDAHCIRVEWTAEDVNFREGSGELCTKFYLN